MQRPSLQEISSALFGVWRLARRDPGGEAFIDKTPDGFWKSFFAAVLLLPSYAFTLWVAPGSEHVTELSLRVVLVNGIAYVLGWVVFPVAAHQICRAIDRLKRYIGYIVAYNWSLVIIELVQLPLLVLHELGLAAESFTIFALFLVLIWSLVYHWYIAKVMLDVPGSAASGLVLVDWILSYFIFAVVRTMLLVPQLPS